MQHIQLLLFFRNVDQERFLVYTEFFSYTHSMCYFLQSQVSSLWEEIFFSFTLKRVFISTFLLVRPNIHEVLTKSLGKYDKKNIALLPTSLLNLAIKYQFYLILIEQFFNNLIFFQIWSCHNLRFGMSWRSRRLRISLKIQLKWVQYP